MDDISIGKILFITILIALIIIYISKTNFIFGFFTISIDINHIKNGDNPKIIMIGI